MSSKDDQTNSPTDTNSATDAIPQWSLAAWLGEIPLTKDEIETTTVKCSNCKVPTIHEWTKVRPNPISDETKSAVTTDFTILADLNKRLICCTQCGLIKTIT